MSTGHVESNARTYVLVWLALVALLALTLASAYLPLGWINPVLNYAISFTQAALVMLFSMHLRRAHPALKVVATVGFFGILILIALSLADVLTR
jgi:cytochrome c oxidase subunit 4